jgi:hypothetical protein
VSAQPGITKTVTALAFSSIFFRQCCSPQLRAAQKLRVLFSQAATGTTPQALSAMNAMIQLNVVALHHLVTRRSNGKPRTRKFRRSVASSPSKFDPSGVARMPQPNQKER